MNSGRMLQALTPLARRGLTVVELLVAVAIMSVITLGLATVASGTRSVADYNSKRGMALQHARVTLDRIQRIVQESTFAESHPGAVVVYDQIGNYRYPDTLLVWHPSGAPANASGPPLLNEVLIYCPDPGSPNQLVEMWAPTNTTPIPFDPAQLNTTTWRTTLANVKKSSTTQKVVLTNLLRTAQPTGQTAARGAVRFEAVANPTAAQIASYRAGSTTWKNLPWPTVLYSNTHGLRQLRVRTELQMVSDGNGGKVDNVGLTALPFFGSTSTYQRLTP